MHTVLYVILILSGLGALIWLLSNSLKRVFKTEQSAQAHFAARFGSVDAMLVLSEVDKDRLRELRDQGRLQRWDAIRDVMRLENVPEEVATEFIDRL